MFSQGDWLTEVSHVVRRSLVLSSSVFFYTTLDENVLFAFVCFPTVEPALNKVVVNKE